MAQQQTAEDLIAALEYALAAADELGLLDVGIGIDQALHLLRGHAEADRDRPMD